MKPTLTSDLIFSAKAWVFRLSRTLKNLHPKSRVKSAQRHNRWHDAPVIAQSITPLWTQTSETELRLTAGKVQNLRITAQALNGLEIQAGETFSFWRQIGRPSRLRGYVEGREIREGCVVPSIAGGLCQLSNALYDAALKANFQIIERHKHTRVIAGSLAEQDRDATIFWNYVDLRFKSQFGFRIEVDLSAADLVVTFKGQKEERLNALDAASSNATKLFAASCETCGVHSCFRHEQMHSDGTNKSSFSFAALLDGSWPEYSQWVSSWIAESRAKYPVDLYLPMDGIRRKKSRYAWNTEGSRFIHEHLAYSIYRGIISRRLSNQGRKRQIALLKLNTQLAKSYARKLPTTALHLVIQQNLLVPLQRLGVLGGRTYDVLMTQMPINRIEAALNQVYEAFPSSPTLADFRCSKDWIQDETLALSRARSIITPHTKIAKLFPSRSQLISWSTEKADPSMTSKRDLSKVLFAGPTVGRKGAYAVREAAKHLNLKVIIRGSELEGPDFWQGINVERIPMGKDHLVSALQSVGAVLAPSIVESRPDVYLQALRQGVPVIASEACGLSPQEGLIVISEPSAKAVIEAWQSFANHNSQ